MKFKEYEIIKYRHEHMDEVIELLKILWKDDYNNNIKKFNWKHVDNPYTDEPVGIVALYNGLVVGFRGFFVLKWSIGNSKDTILILSPADACVDKNHQRSGLFNAMNRVALEEYAKEKYKFILNLSSNKYSTPGYLKLGWINLRGNKEFIKYNISSVVNYILINKFNINFIKYEAINCRFLNIEVSDYPKPEEMYQVYLKQGKGNKIRLHKDLEFFKWRYNNPNVKYKFYYYLEDNNISDYMVSRQVEGNNVEHIVDYSYATDEGIRQILQYIIRNNKNSIIRISEASEDKSFSNIMISLKFKNMETNLLAKCYRKFKKEKAKIPSLLIRPIKLEYDEMDWLLHGINTKDKANWEISDICSDAL